MRRRSLLGWSTHHASRSWSLIFHAPAVSVGVRTSSVQRGRMELQSISCCSDSADTVPCSSWRRACKWEFRRAPVFETNVVILTVNECLGIVELGDAKDWFSREPKELVNPTPARVVPMEAHQRSRAKGLWMLVNIHLGHHAYLGAAASTHEATPSMEEGPPTAAPLVHWEKAVGVGIAEGPA